MSAYQSINKVNKNKSKLEIQILNKKIAADKQDDLKKLNFFEDHFKAAASDLDSVAKIVGILKATFGTIPYIF